MLHVLEDQICQSWPVRHWREVAVLVAVSGGADSVALLRALQRIASGNDHRLHVAHFNHHWRAVDSDRDQALVEELCHTLAVPCRVGHSEGRAAASDAGESLESMARAQRYKFLLDAAHDCGARYIATAHTWDDQVETVLHRIVRGTGISGLSGIPRCRRLSCSVTLIRPMLNIRHADLLAYLNILEQPFREDASNRDLRFTRNRIRHELLPQLAAQYNQRIEEALYRLSLLAGDAQELIETHVEAVLEESRILREADRVAIDRERLSTESPFVQAEVLKMIWRQQGWSEQAMTYQHWCSLATVFFGESAKSGADDSIQTPTNPQGMLPHGLVYYRIDNQVHISRTGKSGRGLPT